MERILMTEAGEMAQSMSMSQKLTLGYAVLVGLGGGYVDYINSGSKMSLLAGTIPPAVLLNVYTDLPARPVLASTMGLSISAFSSDGFPIQEVQETVPSRCHISRVPRYGRDLPTWPHP